MIKEIAFTAYPAKDVKATREWYEKNLGLKFGEPFRENGVELYNEAHVGDGYFSLMTSKWIDRDPGSGVGVAFEVQNIEDTVAKLRSSGITVEDIYETPVCKITSLDDVDGNKVTLHQTTVPH